MRSLIGAAAILMSSQASGWEPPANIEVMVLGTYHMDNPGLDLANGDWSVLVWCQTFGVPVANATPV